MARTLLDLAEVVDGHGVERACERAEELGLFDLREIDDVLARAQGRAGISALLNAVQSWRPDVSFTRSELERRFLALCRQGGIERPQVNAWLELPGDGLEVDFLWRSAGVIAETDGHTVHATRAAFERDRRRDQLLLVAGFRVVRFTWRQLVDQPRDVIAALSALLS